MNFIYSVPGHTHEDIDGVFGQIWLKMRSQQVQTADDYVKFVTKHFNSDKRPMHIEDVFIIPDYDNFFDKHIDPNFNRYCNFLILFVQFYYYL